MVLILFIPLVLSLEECKRVIEPYEIPCQITSTWQYPNACNSYIGYFYWENGTYLYQQNMSDIGMFCGLNFTNTTIGTYYYNITSGDTGIIIVEETNMMLALIIGIIAITGFLIWLAISLYNNHFFLSLLFFITAVIMMTLIPLAILNPIAVKTTFYRFYLYIFIAFWSYIAIYLLYYGYNKLIEAVKKE